MSETIDSLRPPLGLVLAVLSVAYIGIKLFAISQHPLPGAPLPEGFREGEHVRVDRPNRSRVVTTSVYPSWRAVTALSNFGWEARVPDTP